MATDHRRKQLNGFNISGCSSLEQHKSKKKKLESPKTEFSSKSHISLQWDGSKKRVVAKREQIGLRRRDLREFFDTSSQHRSILADILAVPQEIFELENLTEVLSYEVWRAYLSENEREYLMQFLPKGLDAEEVVQALLSGDNIHFGNPSLKWGALLCSGDLHPDAVIQLEQSIKADKKAYYSEIQDYHNDMIKHLQQLKATWEGSKDPENEVLQNIQGRDADKQTSLNENESGFPDLEENDAATSESCSLIGEEKTCSSDYQNSSMAKVGERQQRTHEGGFMKDKLRKRLGALDDGKTKKGDKLQQQNVQHTDGVKFMSCVKVSKRQHQLVKSLKQNGKSIQSKSLNRVLGNLDSLQVQKYEVFVNEVQKKSQEHWLQVAKKDLPAAYESWRQGQLQRLEIIKSLERDMKKRLESSMEEDDEVSPDSFVQDQDDEEIRKHEIEAEEEDDISQESVLEDHNDVGAQQHDLYLEDQEKFFDETCFDEQNEQDGHESNFQVAGKECPGIVLLEDKDPDTVLLDNQNPGTVLREDQNHDIVSLKDRNFGKGFLEGQNGVRGHESHVEANEDSDLGSPRYQSSPQICSGSGSQQCQSPRKLYSGSGSPQCQSQQKIYSCSGSPQFQSSQQICSGSGSPQCQSSQQIRSGSGPSGSPQSQLQQIYSGSGTQQSRSPQQVSSYSGNNGLDHPINMHLENNHVASKLDDPSPNASGFSANAITAGTSINQGFPISPGIGVWPASSMPHTYYDSSLNHEYASNGELSVSHQSHGQGQRPQLIDLECNVRDANTKFNSSMHTDFASTGELSLPHSINEGQRSQFIGLESKLCEDDTSKNMLHRQSDVGSFSSYPNQDRSGLLQSLFKGPDMSSYHREQKQMALDCQLGQNMLMDDGHFQRQLQTSLPLEQGQKRHNQNYMQPSISSDIYSGGGTYMIPRQLHEVPANLQDWPVNAVRMPAHLQPHLNNDALLTQTWYPGEPNIRGGWNGTNGTTISGQGIGNGQGIGSNTDQSLFSVLSQYNQLRSMGSTDQFMLPRNYDMASGLASRMHSSLPQVSLPLDYVSGRETTSSLIPDDMGWMNLPQNPGLRDPVGKPYLRSWNQ